MSENKKTQIQLKPLQRLMLLGILPKKGNIIVLKLIKDMALRIGLNRDEVEYYEIKPLPDGGINYDTDKINEEKEFDFTRSEMKIIKDSFIQKSEKDELLMEHIEIYDKFMGDDDED